MSAALIVTNENEAKRLMPWANLLAQSDGTELHVIIAQQRDGDQVWAEVEPRVVEDNEGVDDGERSRPGVSGDAGEEGEEGEGGEIGDQRGSGLAETVRRLARMGGAEDENAPARVEITMHRLRDPAPDRALCELLPKLSVQLLILPLDELSHESEKQWKGRLYRASSCETVYLRARAADTGVAKRILVPTAGCSNASAALRRATMIADVARGEVTAVYVQSDVGELTRDVGERVLERNVRRGVGRKSRHTVGRKIIVGDSIIDGIEQALTDSHEAVDLVMIGAYRHRTIRKIFFGKLAKQCFSGGSYPAYAAVRAGLPIGTRLQQFCERQVQRFVPQLDRERRVALVERVQTSSNWDFDFIALICLSTCIAALGLVRNQSAVVIGAMLVAPLMTPLAGAGLALVQGNGALIRSSLKSVLFGFLLAYGIGVLVGLAVPPGSDGISPELIARTSPGIVDLLVALVGGIAAAYAMSRPHLSSALPGVAIAAALVPPIATSGIMLARGEWAFARGSVLLFLTNIVAIVLGTAISLRLVGIRDEHHHGTTQRWSRRLAAFLLAAMVGLAFAVSYKAPRTGQAVIDELRATIREEVAKSGATLVSLAKTGQAELAVIVESPEDELGELPQKIHDVAVHKLDDHELRVKLEVRHVVEVLGKDSK